MLIGYIALDENGKPYRPAGSGYPWQKGQGKPPRIYTTQARAETYSPVGKATAVYIEETH